MLARCSGASFKARALPPLGPLILPRATRLARFPCSSGVGYRSSTSPLAMSIMSVAMAYSSYLRDKAEQALRLARDNTDQVLVKSLIEVAAESLGRADAIDLVKYLQEVAAALGEDPEKQLSSGAHASRNVSCRSDPRRRSTNASIDDGSSCPARSRRRMISQGISSEASSDQCSAVLKTTTRPGSCAGRWFRDRR
jgi:hypothetical protein